MKHIYYLTTSLLLTFAIVGCKSTTKSTNTSQSAKYQRAPIVEVSQQQLETDALLIDAKMAQELDNSEKAIRTYQTIITRNPNYSVALYELASLYEAVGMLDSALFFSQKAASIDPQNQWYKLQLCQLYRAKRDFKNETKTWEALIKLAPDKLDYYYELSNAHLAGGNIEEAIEPLNRVERIIGVTEPISLQKQKLWLILGKNEKATQEIERLAEVMPQEKKYNELMAEAYMKQKNYAKAKTYYDRIAKADPTDEYIHISLANYYHHVGDSNATYRELSRGLKSSALTCKDKIQILSSIYTVQEFYANPPGYAFKLLEETLSQCYDTLAYAPLYGDILMHLGRYTEASEQFARYITLDSSRYEVWEAYLVCLSMDSTQGGQMLSFAKRAQNLFPLHILPYFIEGQYNIINHKYGEAEKPLVKCVKLGFNKGYLEADTYSLLAESYYRQDRIEEAWQCFEKALKAEPNNLPILNNYAYYLSEESAMLEKAERMSRQTIQAEPDNATYLDTYAWILFKLGRAADALPYMERAIKADDESSDTLKSHLNVIRTAAGK